MLRVLFIRLVAAMGLSFFTIRVGSLVMQGAWEASWNAHSTFWLGQFGCALMAAALVWFGRGSAVWGPRTQDLPAQAADDGRKNGEAALTGSRRYGTRGDQTGRAGRSYLPPSLLAKREADDVANQRGIDQLCETAVFLFAVGEALLLLAG